MKRININLQQIHFIGCWNLENNKLCNEITNFFEYNKNACAGYGDILLKLNQHSKAIAYIRRGVGLIQFTEKAVTII